MTYGLIGNPLGHSFSEEIHAMIGGYDYKCREVAPADLERFMAEKDFCAINVTIPYKEAVIPFLSNISAQAKAIGAVNTVVNRGGALYGYNTDYTGLAALLEKTGVSLAGKKVLILGTGGTSRTASALAGDLHAGAVYRVSRSKKEGALSYEEAYARHADAEVILNTTPAGMYPDLGACPLDLDRFSRLSGVVDVIYNPLRSRLVLAAEARGIPASGGLFMLIAQAVAASGLFFDRTLPTSLSDRLYRTLLGRKENIVLIGMPSCGKTTVGERLAQKTNRPFFDTDREIEKSTGATPAELIKTKGIEAFRALERKTVAALAPISGAVIATGGGTLLSEENRMALRQNGRFFFLDRPLSCLTPTGDRPLSSSLEALTRLYEERRPLYLAAAQEVIPASGGIDDCIAVIESRIGRLRDESDANEKMRLNP